MMFFGRILMLTGVLALSWLSLVSASFIPGSLTHEPLPGRATTNLQASIDLGPQLSSNASIYGPTDPEWANATERWDTYAAPRIQLVVVPGVEADIPVIVSFSLTE